MIPEKPSAAGNNGYYQPGSHDTNEIKKIVLKFLNNWYWFVLTIAAAFVAAFIYIRYTPPVYEIQSTLLVNEDNSNSPLSALYGRNQGMFQERYFTDWTNINNQVAILSSTPIVSMTLAELDFEVSYYSQGRVSETELYNNAPFQIVWDKNHPQVVESNFYVTLHPDRKITISNENENARVFSYSENRMVQTLPQFAFLGEIQPDSCLTTDAFCFTVVLNENYVPGSSGNYMFRFHTPATLLSRYKSMLGVWLPDNNSSILQLSVRDYNTAKGIEFLNKLIDIYQYSNLEKKNQYANLTIQFIDSQLQNISDSLSISENRLETFRSAHQMINFSAQSQQLLIQINELDKELMQRESQHKYYSYLKSYIESNQETETVIAPSSVGIDDPLLNNFITQLNELINKKTSQTSIRPNSEHPTLGQLNTQIETVKRSLNQSINNIIAQSTEELKNLNQRMQNYNAQIRRLPATERNFVNFERKYRIDSETYTFLLQKLSEARIVKASNTPDGQVLEHPQMKAIVKPQKRKIYSVAFMLGMFFPAGIIFLRNYFNNRIMYVDEIESATHYPVIGTVFFNKEPGSNILLINKPNSQAGERFRNIRGKLILMTKGKEHPVVAVLSALPKEGKTYSAVNIASSFALMQKKTLLMDLDLRNAAVREIFGVSSGLGLVSYIRGEAELREIIFPSGHPMLDVLPAGPVPTNPAKTLLDGKFKTLIGELQQIYDIIILDTPPVNYVSDIFPLNDIIDANVFVVACKVTEMQSFQTAMDEVKKFGMKNVGIVFNKTPCKKKIYNYESAYA